MTSRKQENEVLGLVCLGGLLAPDDALRVSTEI